MTDNIQYILNKENRYEHSWWRIVLIVLASIGFIIVFTFDTLSGTAASSMHSQMFGVSVESNRFSIDVYIQGTAAVSDKNPTQFTPAGQYSQHRKIVSMFFIRLDFFDLERYFSMTSSMVNIFHCLYSSQIECQLSIHRAKYAPFQCIRVVHSQHGPASGMDLPLGSRISRRE